MTDAITTAEKLLQAGAVKLNLQSPFTWASGWKSPIYCDNRKLLSLPFTRDYIKSELSSTVFEKFADADLIAGVATAGIPWGIMVADQLKLPFIYVRPKPKEYGLGNQIEGQFNTGQRVVIIEDLISTGKSSLQVAEILQKNGLEVQGMVSIFSYRFDIASRAFKGIDIPIYSLTDYPTMLTLAVQNGTITVGDEEILLKWNMDPANWSGVN